MGKHTFSVLFFLSETADGWLSCRELSDLQSDTHMLLQWSTLVLQNDCGGFWIVCSLHSRHASFSYLVFLDAG